MYPSQLRALQTASGYPLCCRSRDRVLTPLLQPLEPLLGRSLPASAPEGLTRGNHRFPHSAAPWPDPRSDPAPVPRAAPVARARPGCPACAPPASTRLLRLCLLAPETLLEALTQIGETAQPIHSLGSDLPQRLHHGGGGRSVGAPLPHPGYQWRQSSPPAGLPAEPNPAQNPGMRRGDCRRATSRRRGPAVSVVGSAPHQA